LKLAFGQSKKNTLNLSPLAKEKRLVRKISFCQSFALRTSALPSGKNSSGQNQWAALCAAHDLALKKPKSFVLVYLYNHARTYFSKNF